MRVAALLDPELVEAQLAAVALGPEQIGVALVHRHDVLVVDVRQHPLLLAPDAGAVRPRARVRALAEQALPLRRRRLGELVHVVRDFQQRAVARVVDDLVERIDLVVIADATEPGAVRGLRVRHQSRSSMRIRRVGAVTSGSASMRSSAARSAASRAGCVSTSTGTEWSLPPRPFWITDSIPIPCSPSAPATCPSTPGRSSAVKRR